MQGLKSRRKRIDERISAEGKQGWSQNDLAIALKNHALDLHKNAIQEMEAGKRFITDIELKTIAQVFSTTTDELINTPKIYSCEYPDDDLAVAESSL